MEEAIKEIAISLHNIDLSLRRISEHGNRHSFSPMPVYTNVSTHSVGDTVVHNGMTSVVQGVSDCGTITQEKIIKKETNPNTSGYSSF
jgi:hypothetical protein